MDGKSSGVVGLLGIVGCVAAFLFVRRYSPFLSTILLVIVCTIAVLIILLVALVMYFAFRKPEKGHPAAAKADNNAILNKGRAHLMELRRMGMRIKNQDIRDLNSQITASADKILKLLREKPESIPSVRQFLNYYLPTLGGILNKYVRVEESGIPSGDMIQIVIANLSEIKKAMDKQYASLFDDDILDLSVEMEALTIACKRDGLLSDEDFKLQNDMAGGINLIL